MAPEIPVRVARERQEPVPCPWCGCMDTERISVFGSVTMVSQYLCRRCNSPFEYVRWRPSGDVETRSRS